MGGIDDGISVRAISWSAWSPPPITWRIHVVGLPIEWLCTYDMPPFRVDGGDPGDENDGE